MAKRKMTKKALNIADHNRRLASTGTPSGPGAAWVVALMALGGAALLLYLLK